MFKEFIRYVSLNVISMLGISVYILCDTYFIANGIGTDALSGLNLVLPVFNFIYAVGLMIGMGTATKYSVLVGGLTEIALTKLDVLDSFDYFMENANHKKKEYSLSDFLSEINKNKNPKTTLFSKQCRFFNSTCGGGRFC